MNRITVLIADDHAMVRSGVRGFLEAQPDLEVVGEAADGAEAVRMASEFAPDVVLMDLLMPVLDGVEATRQIRHTSPRSQVIALTSVQDEAYVIPAIKAGALSYVLKDVSPYDLAEAVRAATRGEAVIHPRVAAHLVMELQANRRETRSLFAVLSEREQEVLRHIADGRSNSEIAALLVLSEKTVKGHVSNILGKLHLEDRTQAAVLAWREGLVRRTPDAS